MFFFFFFQAEDGIRDIGVTGVQTCALPISITARSWPTEGGTVLSDAFPLVLLGIIGIGVYVASCLFNPMVTCRKCRGQPRPRGWLFSHAHHLCPRCEGSGHQARLG